MKSRRLSLALHVLVHLAEHDTPTTSEALAGCVRTNPVVIRRTLAALREAGLVHSIAGHGGGWSLARDAKQISVADVCETMGERLVFAMDLALESGCAIEAAVSSALDEVIHDAEMQMLARLRMISIANLSMMVHGRRGIRWRRER